MTDIQSWQQFLQPLLQAAQTAISDPDSYRQMAMLATVVLAAWVLSVWLRRRIPLLKEAPDNAADYPIKHLIFRSGKLLFPLLVLVFLQLTLRYTATLDAIGAEWLLVLAHALTAIFLFNQFVQVAIKQPYVAHWRGPVPDL